MYVLIAILLFSFYGFYLGKKKSTDLISNKVFELHSTPILSPFGSSSASLPLNLLAALPGYSPFSPPLPYFYPCWVCSSASFPAAALKSS